MLVSDCIAYERILLNTPAGGSARWQDSQLVTLTDRAVKSLVAEVRFPESRLVVTAVPNHQQYQLPPLHMIYRVYVNGQIATRTPGGIDTLEGQQILYNDSTAMGTVPAGSGGAIGMGSSLPQWAVATPLVYPFLNSWGVPKPNAQPFFVGQSPRFYTRGGYIGLVPAPASLVPITVDCVRQPTTLTQPTDTVILPDNGDFLEAIANYVVYRACATDKDPLARQLSRDSFADYQAAVRRLRTWKREYSLEDGQMELMTNRAAYRIGGHRSGW